MTRQSRPYDVVLYGASGFVGRQTVAYFAEHAPALRWALAGRDEVKLRQVRQACGPGAAAAGLIVADAQDQAALVALASQARVVLSTAGPFALHGSALVAACVEQRTHYVDITGETPWVRGLIDLHHAQAARDGTRIIPCCGFDSVPSDLGAWLVAHAIGQRFGEACISVKACHAMRGGLNGGTLASALNMMDGDQGKLFAQPFLLNPDGSVPPVAPGQGDPIGPHHDADFGAWVGPFVMGPINTRVVRRSAALLAAGGDAAYAPDFSYQEYLRFGKGTAAALTAGGVTLGLGVGMTALRFKPWRALAQRLMPGPGSGPSERSMDGGWFRCELIGTSAGSRRLRGRVAGKGDPGNRATTRFVCEAALALALDGADLPGGARRGGVLTPASGLGEVLVRRLQVAGMTLEVAREGS
nr:saccharopine dehydrogenase NADP-binding domain-containing protein [uncultured Roseateles sp.]